MMSSGSAQPRVTAVEPLNRGTSEPKPLPSEPEQPDRGVAMRPVIGADFHGASRAVEETRPCLVADKLSAYFGELEAVKDVSLAFNVRSAIAIIGAPGCEKSTPPRCFNGLHETVAGARVTGGVTLGGQPV